MDPADVRRRLLRWYRAAKRDLPWRFPEGRADPYRVWISEAMLQQTQVATAIPYYRRFLERFPTLRALAEAEEDEVLRAWAGLGYYARARSLLRAAREAIGRHGGLPRTPASLRELPGIGPYTAGAVASIAFGAAVPAVDGNAGRVLARLHLVGARTGSSSFQRRVWREAEAMIRGARRPGELNQALIELGALICRPRTPRCEACPLAHGCAARRTGREREIPGGRNARPATRLVLGVAVCLHRGKVLVGRRPSGGLFAGMWSPPLVELRSGRSASAAISSAIRCEPSVRTGEFTDRGTVLRRLTHRSLELRVFSASLLGDLRLPGGWRLVPSTELTDLAVPTAVRAALALVGELEAISRA